MTRRQDVPETDLGRVDDDDIPSNASLEPTIGDVIVGRYSRRQALKKNLGGRHRVRDRLRERLVCRPPGTGLKARES